jgi:TRAP-type C4-dicarboxylate transport system substrate-binding protein
MVTVTSDPRGSHGGSAQEYRQYPDGIHCRRAAGAAHGRFGYISVFPVFTRTVMRRLAIVAALLLAACGSPGPDGSTRSSREVVIAADAAPGSAAESNWRRFADNVGVWAPGYALTLRLGVDAGPPAARATSVRQGALQIAALPPDEATGLVPELALLSAPDLFGSQDEADYILDRIVLDPYRRLFSEKGFRLLDWVDDDWSDPPTRRIYRTGVIVADKGWFERLTPHDRDVFQQAYGSAGAARADSRAAARRAAEAGGGGAMASGTPPGAPADWSEATREAHRAIIARAGGRAQEIYDLVVRARQELATGLATSNAAGAAAPAR